MLLSQRQSYNFVIKHVTVGILFESRLFVMHAVTRENIYDVEEQECVVAALDAVNKRREVITETEWYAAYEDGLVLLVVKKYVKEGWPRDRCLSIDLTGYASVASELRGLFIFRRECFCPPPME